MPELPEVELFTRYWREHALGQTIARVRVLDPRILGEITVEKFRRRLRGQAFGEVRRHGKNLFVSLTREWLHVHFGMSGDLAFYRDVAGQPRFARVVFDFENGAHLAYDDMRLFGVLDLTPSPEAYVAEHELGPDPLDSRFGLRAFRSLLTGKRGAIKALLMSQDVIAGIGNLYADEALYQASIHPARPADRISPDEAKHLFQLIRRILSSTIERKASSRDYPPGYLTQHREEGDRCPMCGGEIRKTVVFGRTTYFCGTHQT